MAVVRINLAHLGFFLRILTLTGALGCVLAGNAAGNVAPKAELPPGLELVVAAAPPLVNYPLMGCFDDRGRLFVGDAAGVNLNRKGLEEQLPNRVLMLEDTNGDGVFDRSTVFADKMTFPQGGCWLAGSLYVASPPGIWKLTDADGDGVAEKREMIVGGFDYDGNAADVHGPFLHPNNGRLYWCHGRKGHTVTQRDGTPVHEGKASGVWSCNPDGSDVQWHSLGSMDNPVELDFAPDGGLFGVVNLYANQPRGDTLMHWLYGGVYERPDQLAAIAGLPRTREHMPVVHNYGHVAVAGCTFYRSGALDPAWQGDMLVAFFNTQKVVRTKLLPAGSTFTATEHEWLKIDDPDVHLTDVIEDGDGSLLVLNTGGWFRLGCPSSLAEKPDLRGAIYRVRRKNAAPVTDAYGLGIAWDKLSPADRAKLLNDERWRVRAKATALAQTLEPAAATELAALRDTGHPAVRLRACERLAHAKHLAPEQRAALLAMLDEPLDPALEHAAMFAGIATGAFTVADLRQAADPRLVRRLLVVIDQAAKDSAVEDALLGQARKHVDSSDPELARTAVVLVARNRHALERSHDDFVAQLAAPRMPRGTLTVMAEVIAAHLAEPRAQALITRMLLHTSAAVRQTAWRVIAGQSGKISAPDWLGPLAKILDDALSAERGEKTEADFPLLLEVVAKLDPAPFAAALQSIVADQSRPAPIRLKALAALARPGQPLEASAFAWLLHVSVDGTSPAAKMDAARLLTRVRLTPDQLQALAPLLSRVGPVELLELLKLGKKLDAATARLWAENLVRSPVFSAVEESVIKSAFSSVPPEIYERTLAPAVRRAAEANDAKKRRMETWVTVAGKGRASEGRAVFAQSACAACHKAGDLGRALGPDLSRIGNIRQPRDLLESILFPSATIARDYEMHVVETSDGQTHTGMIKSDNADALVLLDLAGQEKNLPHAQVVASSVMTTSLMPLGLEQTLTEQQLLDLVAWLGSLK